MFSEAYLVINVRMTEDVSMGEISPSGRILGKTAEVCRCASISECVVLKNETYTVLVSLSQDSMIDMFVLY